MKKDMKATLSADNAEQIADAARQWVASPEGQRAIEIGLERARDMAAQFREALRVDPDILHKPMTL